MVRGHGEGTEAVRAAEPVHVLTHIRIRRGRGWV